MTRAQITQVAERVAIDIANELAADTVLVPGWQRDQQFDKNYCGTYHLFLKQEPGRDYVEDEILVAPQYKWDHLGAGRVAAMTTRGFQWSVMPGEPLDDDFVFTYLDRYMLVDQLVSHSSGQSTGLFARVPRSAEEWARGVIEAHEATLAHGQAPSAARTFTSGAQSLCADGDTNFVIEGGRNDG
jgi:hypothetical protein